MVCSLQVYNCTKGNIKLQTWQSQLQKLMVIFLIINVGKENKTNWFKRINWKKKRKEKSKLEQKTQLQQIPLLCEQVQ